uniref:PHD-type domain-containing protein n=1 Tax=Caenorhabditis japonica TaxID=281687 RepID=A0A8R1IJH7_CAEJA
MKKANSKGEKLDPNPKNNCGVSSKYCSATDATFKAKDLQWVQCMSCDQWFHVWCVRLNNRTYKEEEVFFCCGADACPEAIAGLNGEVYAKYVSRKRDN